MTEFAEAQKWQRVIRSSVREACETWRIQAKAGHVTSDAFEGIVNRAAVPVLTLLQELPPEAVVALVPSVLHIMLAAVLLRAPPATLAVPFEPESSGASAAPCGHPPSYSS